MCKISWCTNGSEPQLSERSKKHSTEKGLWYQINLLCSRLFTNKTPTTVTKCPCHQPLTIICYSREWHFSKPLFDPGIKACSKRYKMDSAHDMRLHYRILSVRHLLDLKAVLFFWKWKYNHSRAFSRLQIAIANLKTHERTLNLT